MIDYHCFRYASAPRTGTTWFLQAAYQCLGIEGMKASVHLPHCCFDKLCVSVVRHPYDWLESYYYVLQQGCIHVDCVDVFMKLNGKSFKTFLRSYLELMPGKVGSMFFAYQADCFLKLEDFPTAFSLLMDSFEISSREVLELPKQNVRNRFVLKEAKKWRTAVEQAEKEMMDYFSY